LGHQADQQFRRRSAKFYQELIEGFAAYAADQFELAAKQSDGATLREHLEAIERNTGRPPKRLLGALELPDGVGPLWADFMHLHSRRGSSGFGSARITDHDIEAWQRLHSVTLSGWELEALYKADDAYFASQAKKS